MAWHLCKLYNMSPELTPVLYVVCILTAQLRVLAMAFEMVYTLIKSMLCRILWELSKRFEHVATVGTVLQDTLHAHNSICSLPCPVRISSLHGTSAVAACVPATVV